MQHLYVGKLFALLHDLGIPQRQVAAHLGVSRGSVATWAGGQLPIPARHVARFLTLVRQTLQAACADAWRQDQPTGPTLLAPSTGALFDDRMKLALALWEVELYNTSGQLDQEYAQHAKTLMHYLHLPPGKLSAAERARMLTALNGAHRCFRALAHLANRPEETAGRQLGGPTGVTPLEYFDHLVAWVHAPHQDDDHTPNTEEVL